MSALEELKRHADLFVQSGMRAYSGYWPNDFYGKEAERYYKWSQRACDLIRELEKADR